MSAMSKTIRAALCAGACGTALIAAGPVLANPGDTYTVTSERVNLRAAPGNSAAIRSTVRHGDELVELKQDGDWTGVRNMRTGEEGWVFTDLLRQRSTSTLSGGTRSAFSRYSSGFDSLIGRINQELGYNFADRVEQGRDGTLRVTPTRDWMYNTSREAKMYAALALYEMWKNHNNGRPSSVRLGLGGENPITVADGDNGPLMDLPPLVGSSR